MSDTERRSDPFVHPVWAGEPARRGAVSDLGARHRYGDVSILPQVSHASSVRRRRLRTRTRRPCRRRGGGTRRGPVARMLPRDRVRPERRSSRRSLRRSSARRRAPASTASSTSRSSSGIVTSKSRRRLSCPSANNAPSSSSRGWSGSRRIAATSLTRRFSVVTWRTRAGWPASSSRRRSPYADDSSRRETPESTTTSASCGGSGMYSNVQRARIDEDRVARHARAPTPPGP